MAKLGGRSTVEEFEKKSCENRRLGVENVLYDTAMIANLKTAMADCGKHAECRLVADDLSEDETGLHVKARWIVQLFPGVDFAICLETLAEDKLTLDVPVFVDDIGFWLLTAAHSAVLDPDVKYKSSADLPKARSLDQLYKMKHVDVVAVGWPDALGFAKRAVSAIVQIRKFCAVLDRCMSADMAATSVRLDQLCAEHQAMIGKASAMRKKTELLWDAVCSVG